MKKIIFLAAALACTISNITTSFGQAGNVYTIAGMGSSTANGVPATASKLIYSSGIAADFAGNIYVGDGWSGIVRKIDATTGLINTVAGDATVGFSGDGGPATAAQLATALDLCFGGSGNLYIADGANNRIRMVNLATGIITTVAGGGTDTADGVPATMARISGGCIFVDNAGNIYVDAPTNKIKRIDHATGIITTIAGNGGTGGDAGDGGPATNACLGGAASIKMDETENLYINTGTRIRKVDNITGIITTVAGGGASTADGVPATTEQLRRIEDCNVDAAGNLFFYDSTTLLIRRVDAATGLIGIIAGGGSSTADGTPALNAKIGVSRLCADASSGYIYCTNYQNQLRRFPFMPIVGSYPISFSDSFSASVQTLCNGPKIILQTIDFVPGRSIKTFFGDGNTDSGAVVGRYLGSGVREINHTYNAVGTYIIKHILYSGPVAEDSVSYPYSYEFCRTLPVSIFYDANGNCIKDSGENYNIFPALAIVDSNGITVDTISATSGFSYDAYSVPGDIYSFRLISSSVGEVADCPSSGVLSDTISISDTSYNIKYFGLMCPSHTSFDLQVNAAIPVTGEYDQWGNIYVRNNGCDPIDASVTLHYSPKYQVDGRGGYLDVSPTPTSYTASSITWNLSSLTPNASAPVDLYYAVWANASSGYLTAGDTVWTGIEVTPVSGDANPSNNYFFIIDTVKAGCDPNEMSVSPAGCLPYSTAAPYQLQYTINFCNTGNDTAFNIVVLDTLNDNIDPSSLRLVSASATMNIEHMKSGGFNIIQFSFPNINLLDSSHHSQCTGSVIFTVNTLPNLAEGSTVFNEAGIYFDFNSVVMTEQVENTLGGCAPAYTPQISKSEEITLYPNPATSTLTIKTQPNTFQTYTITNSLGSTLITNTLTTPTTQVNIKALAAGMYYLRLVGIDGVEVRKFVKE